MYTLPLARIPENLHWVPRARRDVLGLHLQCVTWTMTGRLSDVVVYEEYAHNFEWFAVEPLEGDAREGLARVRQHLEAPHLVDLDEPLYAVALPNCSNKCHTKETSSKPK
ncbi:hypothetical protein GSI_05297 [Ganoderma sinense ZZ0214-1]|uniref:Uncharacterized protein n=1 Tax=Ganoderma sinense ZZ0214-1 TaxID=1077348 RepID=A0A2G8SFP1_9APHY|nr:hypothetical protein GSI_05297 [Ganoderma sinense ZZ0214-1]